MKTNKTITLIFTLLILKITAQYDYFKWNKNSTYNPIGTLASSSGIAVDQYERAFYINGTDFNCIYWQYGKLLNSASSAKSNSNLIHIPDNLGDHLFYIRSDNKIGLIEFLYSNSLWTSNNSYAVTEAINSQMSINAVNTNQIFMLEQVIINYVIS